MMTGVALFMGITLSAGLAVNGSLVHDYLFAGRNELIEYRKEVKSGDTLWNICSEIATDREDPVSYTHLDVYKRQPFSSIDASQNVEIPME